MNDKHISNIKRKDLILLTGARKFLWLEVPTEYSNINFSLLLDFIDKYSDCGKDHKYGNAYYLIRKETNKLLGAWYGAPMNLRLSKREIKTIRKSMVAKFDKKNYLKIPYKISYIFQAIINIINNICTDRDIEIPNELKHVLGISYKIAFYSHHIGIYDDYYKELKDAHIKEPGYNLKVELKNDFHSDGSVFNITFS